MSHLVAQALSTDAVLCGSVQHTGQGSTGTFRECAEYTSTRPRQGSKNSHTMGKSGAGVSSEGLLVR